MKGGVDGARRAARTNAEWLSALVDCGAVGAQAHLELRTLLVSGLRRVLSARGVGDDACEDFAQEALLRVRERIADFRGESRFTTWAMAIATRIAFDELRHKRWRDVSFEALTADAGEPIRYEPSNETHLENRIARERVAAELVAILEHKLTDKQRRVLWAELNGMPHVEIALQLGMTRNALYKLSHDARKRVKALLEAAGMSADDVLSVFE